MKKTILLALMAVISLALFSTYLYAQDVAPKVAGEDVALKVAGIEGKVSVKISPSTEWADAVVGQALNAQDAVKTNDNSQARLEFSDKSSVAMKPNTEISIEELVWTESARRAGLNMRVGELKAMIRSANGPSDFKVKTPTAICGARGTIFYVLTTESETRVFVTDGSVDFTNPESGNTYVIIQNMVSISDISGTVTEPRELTGAEKDQALAGWSGVVAEGYTEPPSEATAVNDQTPNGLDAIQENPAQENKGQQEQEASPI